MDAVPRWKIVVVGDGAVGKTCLLNKHLKNVFTGEYVPTAFDDFSFNMTDENHRMHLLHVFDTAGQVPYILVATKVDLREQWLEEGKNPITTARGRQLKREIKSIKEFVETSSNDDTIGVELAFEAALRTLAKLDNNTDGSGSRISEITSVLAKWWASFKSRVK